MAGRCLVALLGRAGVLQARRTDIKPEVYCVLGERVCFVFPVFCWRRIFTDLCVHVC